MGGGVAQFFALATAIVIGVALADLVIHPTGTAVLVNGANQSEANSLNALLGGNNGSGGVSYSAVSG
jgi:hypothetical protein